MKGKTISFVLPVYNEQEGIRSFWAELTKQAARLPSYSHEFVFIDDGSGDGTLTALKEIAAADPRVSIIEFSRNFGHQIAISAGLDHASGDAVIIMDTDLQDPPATCLDLVRAWEEGAEVAFAKRRTRKDAFMKKLTAQVFYSLLNTLSDTEIPQNVGDFRLLDRKAVDTIRRYREKHRFMRGISAHIGFKQKEVLFDRDERRQGETHYPFRKMLRFSLDAIMGFSSAPLRLISKLGLFMSFLSVLGIVYVFAVKIFQPDQVVTGWSFVVVAIFFIGGVQLTVLGIIGGYIARIYAESQDRPLYIVSRIHGSKKPQS